MTRKFIRVLAATTALTVSMSAFAQDAQADEGVAVEEGEIIVTARRSDERLQDVPVSVQAISGESIQKLAITTADEISKLAPGLTLENRGANTQVVLRGVTWQPASGQSATPIYFNEIPFGPADTLQTLFDVGQIEVLRGPQGTTRGAPSITGAVTITTRKPDLDEIGGFVQGQYGSADHLNIQGAINVPLVKDVLAIRLAGNIDNSEGGRIYSVNSPIKPSIKDRTFRATALLKPTDTLSFQAMYQRRRTDVRSFAQVVGQGSPGRAAAPGFYPAGIRANFNGPALTAEQRASVQDAPNIDNQALDLLTVNADWEVFGQKVTYNFGNRWVRNNGQSFSTADPLNILPGFEPYSSPRNLDNPKYQTHEVRLSSASDSGLPFEYDIGWYGQRSRGTLGFTIPLFSLLPLGGAFGAPGTLPGVVTAPDSRYFTNINLNIFLQQKLDSFYGNVRIPLGEKTELSGGVAIIKDHVVNNIFATSAATLQIAAPVIALGGATCPQAGLLVSNYPGFCDAPIPANSISTTDLSDNNYSKTLYNFSLSHKIADDVLVYATTGSSFRTGLAAIFNPGLPSSLLVPAPESAKSYELGIKASFGRRFKANLSVFQLDYKDKLTTFEGVRYRQPTGGETNTSLAFYRNLDSRVRGFELELAARPIDGLSLGANVSYSQITSKGASVPCTNPAVLLTAASPINFCPSPVGEVLNTTAPFQASINGSYEMPITDAIDGYVRFNLNVQGNNPNFGNFRTNGAFKNTPSHAILDLFAGINGGDGAWNLGVYAKNITNKQVENARVLSSGSPYPPFGVTGGYDVVRTSLPREIGVTLRYAFGSR